MKRLYIIRGLPGSGKSYLTREIINIWMFGEVEKPSKIVVASNDDFHIHPVRGYQWSMGTAEYAALWCRAKVAKAMFDDAPLIIVDNMHLTLKTFQPYLDLAAQFRYHVFIKQPATEWAFDPEECAKRNVHKVPLEVIQKMLDSWQDIQINHN
jgi:predicted kinase